MDTASTIDPQESATDCPCFQVYDSEHPHACKLCQRAFTSAQSDLERKLALQAAEMDQLKRELAEKVEALQRMRQDMQTLNQKYVAEIERVASIQYEKDMVEHELEELSTRLFEEANDMVAQERRQRCLLENQLRQTEEHLAAEQSQLQELRERMQEMMTTVDSQKNMLYYNDQQQLQQQQMDPHVARAQRDLQELYSGCKRATLYSSRQRMMKKVASSQSSSTGERAASMPPLPSSQKEKRTRQPMTIDEFQLEAFREFVTMSPKAPLKKLHQFAYMKHCQAEDIEPCLRFGPHSRLSVKKMMDYLARQPCFIEQLDEEAQKSLPMSTVPIVSAASSRPLWERFSTNHHQQQPGQQQQKQQQASLLRCSACARLADHEDHPLSYRFRLDEMDEWAPIDQYCRDRLVAVCEFYVFIRNIQKGLYADRSIDDLYTENIRLRLQMFYSRMGALPVVLDGIGLEPDAVGKASPPLDTIPDDAYVSDCSSSTAPQTPTIQQQLPNLTIVDST